MPNQKLNRNFSLIFPPIILLIVHPIATQYPPSHPTYVIYRKNKSFRPRERPKKGLKNLQSVKTLSAGQNINNQTSVKSRKQPLTVTAQFQNSLIALMETLNQVSFSFEFFYDFFSKF